MASIPESPFSGAAPLSNASLAADAAAALAAFNAATAPAAPGARAQVTPEELDVAAGVSWLCEKRGGLGLVVGVGRGLVLAKVGRREERGGGGVV